MASRLFDSKIQTFFLLPLTIIDYAALLTPANANSASLLAGSGRLSIRKKILTYSFVTNEAFGWPKLVTFLDPKGNIIEEFPMQRTAFHNATGKVCGSWSPIPKRYRRTLRRHELHAQLTNARGEMIQGRVARHFGLASELFSSLMVANNGQAGTASAIVTYQHIDGAHTLHATVLIKSIFGSNDVANITVVVSLKSSLGGETRITEEQIMIEKVDEVG